MPFLYLFPLVACVFGLMKADPNSIQFYGAVGMYCLMRIVEMGLSFLLIHND